MRSVFMQNSFILFIFFKSFKFSIYEMLIRMFHSFLNRSINIIMDCYFVPGSSSNYYSLIMSVMFAVILDSDNSFFFLVLMNFYSKIMSNTNFVFNNSNFFFVPKMTETKPTKSVENLKPWIYKVQFRFSCFKVFCLIAYQPSWVI